MAEAPTSFQLDIVTPDRCLYSGRAVRVSLPTAVGEIGVLPGHADLLSLLGTGVLTLKEDEYTEKRFFCRGGFVEVSGHGVAVLCDIAETEQDIDFARADQSRTRAEERLFSGSPDVDYARASASLSRALYRLQIAHRH